MVHTRNPCCCRSIPYIRFVCLQHFAENGHHIDAVLHWPTVFLGQFFAELGDIGYHSVNVTEELHYRKLLSELFFYQQMTIGRNKRLLNLLRRLFGFGHCHTLWLH